MSGLVATQISTPRLTLVPLSKPKPVGIVDPSGDMELGYGLAAECRGLGYGNEVVAALFGLADPGTTIAAGEDV
jgi:hypothetical protein